MSTTRSEPRALCSKDGQTWTHNVGNGPVVKIVIGEATIWSSLARLSDEVRQDFETCLPTVTHLYLWQIENLKALPPLPARLKCLDVRGCAELKSLPELPEGLENLDVAGCSNLSELPDVLPSRSKRFFCTVAPGSNALNRSSAVWRG